MAGAFLMQEKTFVEYIYIYNILYIHIYNIYTYYIYIIYIYIYIYYHGQIYSVFVEMA